MKESTCQFSLLFSFMLLCNGLKVLAGIVFLNFDPAYIKEFTSANNISGNRSYHNTFASSYQESHINLLVQEGTVLSPKEKFRGRQDDSGTQ